jgi:hypothetical protein
VLNYTTFQFVDPKDIAALAVAEQYTLTSKEPQGKTIQLNGQELKLGVDDILPSIVGSKIDAGKVKLPSTSITFITFANAANKNLK